MHYKIDASINNVLKIKQKYYRKSLSQCAGSGTGGVSYSIYNYIKNNISGNDFDYYPYRSIIMSSPENRVLAFSPIKSITFQQFCKVNPYFNNDIIVNEWIEGTMINLFFDERIQSWEISTKSSVGGDYVYKPYNTSTILSSAPTKFKTYYKMFLEALLEDVEKPLNDIAVFSNFSKKYSYSFVLQHPDNHILLNIAKPRLYLVNVFEMEHNTNRVAYISPIVYENWGMFSDIQGVILFPKRYKFNTYDEIVEKMGVLRSKIDSAGIVLTNSLSGERTTIRNKSYDKLYSLLKVYPVNQYQYLCLKKVNKVEEFLSKYPSYRIVFDRFEQEYNHFITNVHNSYYMFFVKKNIRKEDLTTKYIYHIYKLHHEIYLPSLSSVDKRKITKPVIREYFQNFEPHQILYYLNYERREHVMGWV
uniref:Uncharacterized protein n=1 Tax=viral metagenome TaxID=1070528 RepID=A0A6C0DPQ7_9ZZZZ